MQSGPLVSPILRHPSNAVAPVTPVQAPYVPTVHEARRVRLAARSVATPTPHQLARGVPKRDIQSVAAPRHRALQRPGKRDVARAGGLPDGLSRSRPVLRAGEWTVRRASRALHRSWRCGNDSETPPPSSHDASKHRVDSAKGAVTRTCRSGAVAGWSMRELQTGVAHPAEMQPERGCMCG